MNLKPGTRRRIRLVTGLSRMGNLFEVKNPAILAFDIVDHGVEHEQYFEGASSGKWDDVYTGIGASKKEAVEDAVEQLSYDYEASEEILKEIEKANDDKIHYGVGVRGNVKDNKLLEPKIDDTIDIQLGAKDSIISIGESTALAIVFETNPKNAAEQAIEALGISGLNVEEAKGLVEKDKILLDANYYYYVSVLVSKDSKDMNTEEAIVSGFEKVKTLAESLKEADIKIPTPVEIIDDPLKSLSESNVLETLDEDFKSILGVKKKEKVPTDFDFVIQDTTQILKAIKNGSLEFQEAHSILKKMTEFLHEAVEKTLSETEEEAEGEPVKHTIKLEVGLADIAKDLGYDDWTKVNDYLDADVSTWRTGYSAKDAQNWNLPSGVDHDAANIFPSAVAMAMDSAESEALAAAIGEARRDAVVAALEKIQVTGEYMTSDGEMIAAGEAGIKSAHIDGDKVVMEIENPEHLINDLMHGDGRFYPEFSPYEKASPEEIKKYLHYIGGYFDIYGDSKPDGELDRRFSPDIDGDYFKEEFEYRVSEMTLKEIADEVMDAVEAERFESEADAIEAAARISGKSKKEVAKAVKEHLVNKATVAQEKADRIKEEANKKSEAKLTESKLAISSDSIGKKFSESKKVKTYDVVVYDNHGKTADKYTVLIRGKKGWDIYTMSENPTAPNGVNQYSHTEHNYEPSEEETRIPLDKLPSEVLKAIKDRSIQESKRKVVTIDGYRKIFLGESVLKTFKLYESISSSEEERIVSELAASVGEEFKEEIHSSLDTTGGRYSSWGEAGSFKADGIEYNFILSEDEAERIAQDLVKQDIESEPELFNQDFLADYVYISDVDKRIIAGEEADSRLEDFKGTDEERDDEHEKIYKEVYEALNKDPIGYFVDDLGAYTREEILKQPWIQIDVSDAANAAVSTDGWAHFLSLYSGEYETTSGGIVYFRE